MDARVLDYLDDKIQSITDVSTLDTLLETVRSQQTLLKKQLDEARKAHDDSQAKAKQHTDDVRQRATKFQKEQRDIDRRLLIVTQSETSDDAVAKFEASMGKLHNLDVATGFVELLNEVDELKSACTSQLGKSDDAALVPYSTLQQLVRDLRPLQDTAEGAAPHLLDYISQQLFELQQRIQKSFSADLEKTLKKMNWPKALDTVPLALEQEWATNVGKLFEFQRQDLEAWEQNARTYQPSGEPPVLLPLEVMAHPLEQRFTYHFSGTKATNRLDKPEYFLTHTTDLISSYSDFLQNGLQPLLVRHFQGSDIAFRPAYIDATSAFITALLPMLRRKISSFASQVANQPNLLSHLVHETISFDVTLKESFAYTPISPAIPWEGLAYYLLDTRGYFNQWVDVERDFALSRYESIIDAPDQGELDYDSVSADASKPTKSTVRVNDLLETITDRYRSLSSFSQKIRFVIDIQISIFDQFYARLFAALQAFETMTTSIGRRIQGVSREERDELLGIKGLHRLCRIFGSAEFLERAMRDWNDDVFFLELYQELQHRIKTGSRLSQDLGTVQEIQQKTSRAVGQDNTGDDDDDDAATPQGALFDETAAHYRRLRMKSEEILVETLNFNINRALTPYLGVRTWASLSMGSVGGSLTAELDATLRLLEEYFSFLSRVLGKAALRRISRQVCHAIQLYIWDNILTKQNFSTAGATQLSTDVAAIAAHIDRYVGPHQARAGLHKLLEGVTLLSLPVRGEIPRVRSGVGDEDDSAWDEGGEVEEGQGEGDSEAERKKMGLFEVERLVFMDNESARHALALLQLDSLSAQEARSILERRVELNS